MSIFYAGIGARSTPVEVLQLMTAFASNYANSIPSVVLRSGGADGADSAFARGADMAKGRKQIFIPWGGYNNSRETVRDLPEAAFDLASKYHPNWGACKLPVRKLHARNMQILFGQEAVPSRFNMVSFVMCWTADGKASGGTGQALRAAAHHQIPIFNLFTTGDLDEHVKQIGTEIEELTYQVQMRKVLR